MPCLEPHELAESVTLTLTLERWPQQAYRLFHALSYAQDSKLTREQAPAHHEAASLGLVQLARGSTQLRDECRHHRGQLVVQQMSEYLAATLVAACHGVGIDQAGPLS